MNKDRNLSAVGQLPSTALGIFLFKIVDPTAVGAGLCFYRTHVAAEFRIWPTYLLAEELARPIADFCRQHPLVRLTLLNPAGLRTLDVLLAGEADLAVLPLAAEVMGGGNLVEAEPLCERKWAVILPQGHPLAQKRRPALKDIVHHQLILPEQESNWRKRVDALFLAAGLLEKMQVVLEVNATLTARRFVSLGLGIAILPMPGEVLELPGTVVRPLEQLAPEQIGFVWRKGSQLRPPARLFADFLKTQLKHGARRAEQRKLPG